MKRSRFSIYSIYFIVIFALLFSSQANSFTGEDFERLAELNTRLTKAEALIFAPKTYKEYKKNYDNALRLKASNGKADKIDKALAKCWEFGENALKSVDVTREALKEYLEPRDKARQAGAPRTQAALYNKGEALFLKVTEKIEKGDIKGGLKDASKASPHFDRAELEAIRSQVVKEADELIAKAEKDMARKFALITLDKAINHRARASAIIDKNRYDREAADANAALASYEARHASELAQRVRSIKKNDQAWEQLMLGYEIFMQKAADKRGLSLRFDQGALTAADQLSGEMSLMSDSILALVADKNSLAETVTDLCSRLGVSYDQSGGPEAAFAALESEFGALVRELDDLRGEVRLTKSDLEKTQQERENTAALLEAKRAEEQKFNDTKALFTPTEALTLYNASGDIVIRLRGLTFQSGRFTIEERHNALLSKVTEAMDNYSNRTVIIEGHTDNTGSGEVNRSLSEKRALAVMDYLRQSTGRPASDFRAIGYGAEKPVANNQSKQGRAENRRIDIVILR